MLIGCGRWAREDRAFGAGLFADVPGGSESCDLVAQCRITFAGPNSLKAAILKTAKQPLQIEDIPKPPAFMG